jgi:hypothetical protein
MLRSRNPDSNQERRMAQELEVESTTEFFQQKHSRLEKKVELLRSLLQSKQPNKLFTSLIVFPAKKIKAVISTLFSLLCKSLFTELTKICRTMMMVRPRLSKSQFLLPFSAKTTLSSLISSQIDGLIARLKGFKICSNQE